MEDYVYYGRPPYIKYLAGFYFEAVMIIQLQTKLGTCVNNY